MYLRGIFLHYFIQKKSINEAQRILVETYGDHALSETACRDRLRRFRNFHFHVENKERSCAPKKFEDEELEVLLHEESCQAQNINSLIEAFVCKKISTMKRHKIIHIYRKL